METHNATISRTASKQAIVFQVDGQKLTIDLAEDNPNNVKTVFNKLIQKLKTGLFIFKLDDNRQDLYHHVCEEYIKQLNSEMATVYKELEEYELLAIAKKGKK